MEKNSYPGSKVKRILITGPESTGKSELALALARSYGGTLVPEYAREYIENLGRPYVYSDVEHIARQQDKSYGTSEKEWIFFDTWLVITKVWFEVVFQKMPGWLEPCIRRARFELVLLCATDIPWIPDPVRENGGEMREKLLDTYKRELDRYGMEWALVSGTGEERCACAIKLIDNKIAHGKT